MSFRDIRRKIYIGVPIVVIPLIAIIFGYQHCKSLPDATKQIGVTAIDFKEPVKEAMNIWNRAAGCNIFTEGSDAVVLSTDGQPCNLVFHHNISDGHSAGAYQCSPDGASFRGYLWEVHVEKPGDLRTQTCIAIHELGHVLGLEDTNDKSKAMHTEWCPPDGKILWPADSESKTVAKEFCP